MGESVLERSLEAGDSERERDREGTDAEDGDRDLERLRLLLGGVRESERDLDRLGDRLYSRKNMKTKINILLNSPLDNYYEKKH